MAFNSLKDNLHKVSTSVEDYTLSLAEYYKLKLFKSTMKGAVSLVHLLVYGSLSLFVLLFLSIGAAFWLATFFDNVYVGFLIVGAFYGILLLLMFIFGKNIIEKKILNKFSGLLYDEEDLASKVANKEQDMIQQFPKVNDGQENISN